MGWYQIALWEEEIGLWQSYCESVIPLPSTRVSDRERPKKLLGMLATNMASFAD
jgi:hypothetical protein